MFDHCWIQLLQTSKLLFGSLATPPFITARFQFIVLINCKTQQIKFELKYFPKMVSKMFRIDRKTILIKYFPFQTEIYYSIFYQNLYLFFFPSKSKVCCKKLAENPWWFWGSNQLATDPAISFFSWFLAFSFLATFWTLAFLQHFELFSCFIFPSESGRFIETHDEKVLCDHFFYFNILWSSTMNKVLRHWRGAPTNLLVV